MERSKARHGSSLRQLNWDDLRFFLSVCRYNTVSAAAQQLAVNHTTVTRRIARLESMLNAKLFEHQTTGYTLTPVGKRFYRAVEDIETSIVACETETADSNELFFGVVRVGAPDGVAAHFLAPYLAALCNKDPRLSIELVPTDREVSLTQREIDIMVGLTRPLTGRILSKKLTDFHIGLYASSAYLARTRPVANVKDLTHLSFIRSMEEASAASHHPELMPMFDGNASGFRSRSLVAQLNAIKEGGGIGLLPTFIGNKVDGLVPVLPAQVGFRRSLYIMIHEDNKNLARVRGVANSISQFVRENSALFLAS